MNILISGGSGTVGKKLTQIFQSKGDTVFWLSRNPEKQKVKSFFWNPDSMEIDKAAFENADVIINLAGATVAKRWTKMYKEEIRQSRINGTKLLLDFLNNNPNNVKQFISASAIGIYGNTEEVLITEDSKPADGFLADVCTEWEYEAKKLKSIPVSIVRIGIVLDKNEGALPQMLMPVKFGLGAPLGSGKQFVSWIHVEDLCRIVEHITENKLSGIYNAVAPHPVTNRELTRLIAATINMPCFLPPVPGFVLYAMVGEMAGMVLAGCKVSADKLQNSGFVFKYENAKSALAEILVEK